MEDLIKALQIFLKYGKPRTHCEHDVLYICGIRWEDVSEDDQQEVDKLGFFFGSEEDSIMSYRHGSA